MSNKRVAVLTTVFPMDARFLDEFFGSLALQSCNSFDVIVVNDGYGLLEEFSRKYPTLNIIELNHSGTPAKNREKGLRFVKDSGYDIVIFADSDDYFDSNRVEEILQLLNSNDIVVNDISLFDDNGVFQSQYFKNRIIEGELICAGYVREKNIFGMSNTAFNLVIYDGFSFPEDLIAVDWYLFTRLLLQEGREAIFTSRTQTYYRQYSSNTVGMKNLTLESFSKGIEVKKRHYRALMDQGHYYAELYQEIVELETVSLTSTMMASLERKYTFPFWWENIRSY